MLPHLWYSILLILYSQHAYVSSFLPVQRACVFKWVGAVAVYLGADGLGCHLAPLLRPVYREYVDSREMAGGHSLCM